MDRVEQCTQELMEAIRSSEEYLDFEEKKKVIAAHPELRSQIDEFRRKVYLLQNSDASMDLLEDMGRMFRERERVYKNVLVGDYLKAELRICRILQKISMEVLNVTDVEIDGFEDVISV